MLLSHTIGRRPLISACHISHPSFILSVLPSCNNAATKPLLSIQITVSDCFSQPQEVQLEESIRRESVVREQLALALTQQASPSTALSEAPVASRQEAEAEALQRSEVRHMLCHSSPTVLAMAFVGILLPVYCSLHRRHHFHPSCP